jgi:hypothetical protein
MNSTTTTTTATELFDRIAERTGLKRDVCKTVIYCLLYQGPIVRVCLENRLILEEVLEISIAFNDIVRSTD